MENFLSFNDKVEIDLMSSGYKILMESNVWQDTLKGSFFIGANASGKTNILKGIKMLLDLLFAERVVHIITNRCIFSDKNRIELKYQFKVDDHIIEYEIKYDIEKECLIEKLHVDGESYLNRIGSHAESKITENKSYTDIDQDTLLLREIFFNTKFRNHEILKKWFDFLMHSVYIDGYREYIFSPKNVSLDLEEYLEENGAETINTFFENFNFNQRIEYAETSKGSITSIKSIDKKNIFFKREGIGEPIPFPMESLGNQKLLLLLPTFFHVIQNGGMLIVDEFSSGLHNFLEELLIKYFNKMSKEAQLFLVSHSTNLLSNSILRPDQIYAVHFSGKEGSKVKRFSSEQPRAAQNLEKMYTSGVFGGVPHYRDENQIK